MASCLGVEPSIPSFAETDLQSGNQEKSVWEVLPLLCLRYQHSASLFGLRRLAEGRRIELLKCYFYADFQNQLLTTSRTFHLAETGGIEPLQRVAVRLFSRQVIDLRSQLPFGVTDES